MKLAFVAVCLCACTTAATQPKQLDEAYYNPPRTTDYTIVENHHPAAVMVDDTATYEASLAQIEAQMHDEQFHLTMCKAAHLHYECIKMRANYCAIDTLVDSRGGRHYKPYCQGDTQ
jgi:hypothetical protein